MDYPGPVAVKAGGRLVHCRRISEKHDFFHVDVSKNRSPLAWPNDVSVSKVIRASEGIFHFSWVRPQAWLEAKLGSWSHSAGRDWSHDIQRWIDASNYPIVTTFRSQFVDMSLYNWPFMPVQIPDKVRGLLGQCLPMKEDFAG